MSQRVARGVCIYWPAANYTRQPINHGSLTQCSFIFTGDASARERRRYGRAPLPLPSLAAAFTVFLFRSFSAVRSFVRSFASLGPECAESDVSVCRALSCAWRCSLARTTSCGKPRHTRKGGKRENERERASSTRGWREVGRWAV